MLTQISIASAKECIKNFEPVYGLSLYGDKHPIAAIGRKYCTTAGEVKLKLHLYVMKFYVEQL